MIYLPSVKMVIGFVLLVVIAVLVIIAGFAPVEDSDVLGTQTKVPSTVPERFGAIVTTAANTAVSQVRNQTEALLVEQATQIVATRFDSLSAESQAAIYAQVCSAPAADAPQATQSTE